MVQGPTDPARTNSSTPPLTGGRSCSGAYQRYRLTDGPGDDENEQILLWPLYFTPYLIDDFSDDEDFFGANGIVISSASSRPLGAAYLPRPARP